MQGCSLPPMLLKELHWGNDGNVLSELPLLPVHMSFETYNLTVRYFLCSLFMRLGPAFVKKLK